MCLVLIPALGLGGLDCIVLVFRAVQMVVECIFAIVGFLTWCAELFERGTGSGSGSVGFAGQDLLGKDL
jgi:hypothetical protein